MAGYIKEMSPKIVILCGGVSSEREVALKSGQCFYEGLKDNFNVQIIDVTERALPEGLNPEDSIIFPVFHGEFGEDGQIQKLLEDGGFIYVGADSSASALCMSKILTKRHLKETGIRMAEDVRFHSSDKPFPADIIKRLGNDLVLKASNQGSTIDLYMIKGEHELTQALEKATYGDWLIERKIQGRDMSIGILDGRALGIVEILPHSGFYDYHSKYTPGSTTYNYPAKIDIEIESEMKQMAEIAARKCNCRDYGRVDFILSGEGKSYFLEINTIPGFTKTSLLPKSASCEGIGFEELCEMIVEPALERFKAQKVNKVNV